MKERTLKQFSVVILAAMAVMLFNFGMPQMATISAHLIFEIWMFILNSFSGLSCSVHYCWRLRLSYFRNQCTSWHSTSLRCHETLRTDCDYCTCYQKLCNLPYSRILRKVWQIKWCSEESSFNFYNQGSVDELTSGMFFKSAPWGKVGAQRHKFPVVCFQPGMLELTFL